MNVYDWDDTIYRGDSTFGFVMYLYRHYPLTWLSIPRTAVCGLLFVLKIMPKLRFKQNMYHMFVFVKDMDRAVEDYTSSHLDHVKKWYRENQKEDDVVISASPEFLISSFCRKTGISVCMASRVDLKNGVYDGLNCHGKEKVRRYREVYGDRKIDSFYSDSLSDTPLAEIADEAYIVKGDELVRWPGK